MDHPFFSYLYRLRYIERWSLMRNVVRENVAEHSFHVAILTHMLCSIGNTLFGRSLPTDALVSMALFHDATEMFTGDIPTPVKHHNPKILDSFREIEQLAAERLVSMIPDPLKPVYEPLLKAKSQPSHPHAAYIKAADLLDAYLKCTAELSAGNREFSVAREQILASLRKLGLPEVEYFLTYLAPSFEKTLDELSPSAEGQPRSD
jgi:5'-deoxynucleotidase